MIAYVLLALVLGLFAAPAQAVPLDGSTPLLCASMDSFVCEYEAEDGCRPGDADDIATPDFYRLDLAKKQLTALDEEVRDQTTQIEKVSKIDGRVIVQGVEAGRGWSLLLDPETGHTILTVSGDDVAFIVFGECARP